MSTAGPPQGAKAPSGGSAAHAVASVGAIFQRPSQQVDVFTAIPYRGNPLAVVLDGSGLSDVQMQRFAHWTNLS